MTPRQREVLDWIKSFFKQHGFAPSFQEIAEGVGVSKTAILAHVAKLTQQGLLVRRSGVRSRAIALPSGDLVSREDAIEAAVRATGEANRPKITRRLKALAKKG